MTVEWAVGQICFATTDDSPLGPDIIRTYSLRCRIDGPGRYIVDVFDGETTVGIALLETIIVNAANDSLQAMSAVGMKLAQRPENRDLFMLRLPAVPPPQA